MLTTVAKGKFLNAVKIDSKAAKPKNILRNVIMVF